MNKFAQLSISIFTLWKISKNILTRFVLVFYFREFRIVEASLMVIVIFTAPSDDYHSVTVLQYFNIIGKTKRA